MRGKSDEEVILDLRSAALESIVYARLPEAVNAYSKNQMREILCLGDQIVTLAGTFSYDALDKAARSLCDVADGLVRTKRNDMASIHVHMRALRLLAPGAHVRCRLTASARCCPNWRRSWRIAGFERPFGIRWAMWKITGKNLGSNWIETAVGDRVEYGGLPGLSTLRHHCGLRFCFHFSPISAPCPGWGRSLKS